MLSPVSQSITFLAFFVANKQGKTGLTVTVDIYRNNVSVVTAQAATEIGGGLYLYTLTSGNTANAGLYSAIFKTTDITVDQRHLPGLWVVGQNSAAQIDGLRTDLTTARAGYLDKLNLVTLSTASVGLSNVLHYKAADDGVKLVATLMRNGAAISLSDASSVVMRAVNKADGTILLNNATMTIDDPTNGVVGYQPTIGTPLLASATTRQDYNVEFLITRASGRKERIPTDGYALLMIHPNLIP